VPRTTLPHASTLSTNPPNPRSPKRPQHGQQANRLTLSPSVKPEQFSDTPSVQKWLDNYLWVGETVMDQSVAFFASSSYFERKR
jgi:hypothetical protein